MMCVIDTNQLYNMIYEPHRSRPNKGVYTLNASKNHYLITLI